MGFGGISVWQLLIILLIVVVIFGTKRLRGMGSDLGGAFKSFRSAMRDSTDEDDKPKELGAAGKDADFGETRARSTPERERDKKSAP
ncbi:MAG: twin-arginine translocase TatA/TatE family subunit [Gammaproteobacteria bacterium]|nr:twin-arginine translocase TatA/TatE family subunit [Gammaproteobacteria bacterium]